MTRRLRWLIAGVVLGAIGSRRLAKMAAPRLANPTRRAARRLVGDVRAALHEGVRAARETDNGRTR